MTEYSRPWPGRAIGDAGPYTAPHWWDVWHTILGAGGSLDGVSREDIGVIYAALNRLVTTYTGVNTIQVATGCAVVDGLWYYNDAAENITVPSATAGNVRDDRLVIRKTYSAAVQTARLTLLTGTEAAAPGPGVPPALTQDTARTTYWDIPLYRCSVTDAGVVTLTDEREFVDAETKYFFAPALHGYNVTGAANIPITYISAYTFIAIELPDVTTARADGRFMVPQDFISDMVVTAVVQKKTGPGAANLYGDVVARYATCGEDSDTHTDSNGDAVATITHYEYECVYPLTLTNANPGDFVNCWLWRDSVDVLDTLGEGVYVVGFEVSYLGWKR